MIPGISAGRRGATWLTRLGLPGAIALLVLAATIAAVTASRPAAAARGGYDWETRWRGARDGGGHGIIGMRDRAQAVVFAYESGLVQPGQ